jgi:hypothetical protein
MLDGSPVEPGDVQQVPLIGIEVSESGSISRASSMAFSASSIDR